MSNNDKILILTTTVYIDKTVAKLIQTKAEKRIASYIKAIKLWLPQIAKGGGKDIYIFFAGHGLASNDGKELYLLPKDSDPDLLARTAL